MKKLKTVKLSRRPHTLHWETQVRQQLFAQSPANDPAVAIDIDFLRTCIASNTIHDLEWFYSIFHDIPPETIRNTLLNKQLSVQKIILACLF